VIAHTPVREMSQRETEAPWPPSTVECVVPRARLAPGSRAEKQLRSSQTTEGPVVSNSDAIRQFLTSRLPQKLSAACACAQPVRGDRRDYGATGQALGPVVVLVYTPRTHAKTVQQGHRG